MSAAHQSPITFTPSEIRAYCSHRVPGLRESSDRAWWTAPCPVHQGKDPNFHVNMETGAWHCHSQCGRGGDLIGLEMELSGAPFLEAKRRVYEIIGTAPPPVQKVQAIHSKRRRPPWLKPTEYYPYLDLDRQLKYQTIRFEGINPGSNEKEKDFSTRQPDPAGDWIPKEPPDAEKILYRWPDWHDSENVLLAEGERKADDLSKLGFSATSALGGSGRPWLPQYTAALQGKRVAIFQDNDPGKQPGQKWALRVAKALHAADIYVKLLPVVPFEADNPHGQDVTDWIRIGKATRDDVVEFIRSAPEYTPSVNDEQSHDESSQASAAPSLPTITVNGRQMRDVSNDTLQALRDANQPPTLFIRAGVGRTAHAAREHESGRAVLRETSVTSLRGRAARVASFLRVRKDERSGQFIETNTAPPREIIEDIHALSGEELGFPLLEGLIECPTLRPDGTILSSPGYDPATRLYYSPDSELHLASVPDVPTSDDIEAANGWIDEALYDFPFIDAASRANARALLITSVIRTAIRGPVPIALIDATSPGSGKSLLAEVTSIIATGRDSSMTSPPADSDEWRKVLTSILIAGWPLAVLDNLTRRLDSQEFCKTLTASVHGDRLLGQSTTVELPNRTVWVATGNNLSVGGDIPRRAYWIRMDAQCARPFERSGFRHSDLKAYVRAHRGELVAAILILSRAWFVAGCPAATGKPLGSFEDWAQIIGGILQHSGIEGFLANAEERYEAADVEGSQWAIFLEVLRELFYGEPFTVAGLWTTLNSPTAPATAGHLREALPDFLSGGVEREGLFKQRCGVAFRERAERRYGSQEFRLVKAGIDRNSKSARWQVLSKVREGAGA